MAPIVRIDAEGERSIRIDAAVADKPKAMRGPGESCSDVVLRLVELEGRQAAALYRSLTPVQVEHAHGRRLAHERRTAPTPFAPLPFVWPDTLVNESPASP